VRQIRAGQQASGSGTTRAARPPARATGSRTTHAARAPALSARLTLRGKNSATKIENNSKIFDALSLLKENH
jgi:hypothetical protein